MARLGARTEAEEVRLECTSSARRAATFSIRFILLPLELSGAQTALQIALGSTCSYVSEVALATQFGENLDRGQARSTTVGRDPVDSGFGACCGWVPLDL